MLKLAPIFTDHAVLQRGKPVRIFGTADTQTVTVRYRDAAVTAPVRPDGTWTAVLPAMPAGAPETLTVTADSETLTREDVVLGDVWLCGGQSNMELTLGNSKDPAPALAACADQNVRLYHVGKHGHFDDQFYAEEAASCWQLPCRDACQHWTAVGYHFAAMLSAHLGVTIGLVECCYGGTSVSAWLSEETLRASEAGRAYLDDYAARMGDKTEDEANADYLAYCRYQQAWEQRAAACYAKDPHMRWADVIAACGENRYPGPAAPIDPLRPHGLYDTMIARIVPYTMKGVLYYQGESDDHRPDTYAALLRDLIGEWRREFRDAELPFLLVQLPMFVYANETNGDNWARIRAAQEQGFRTVKNTGLAVILDCGEFDEIHPKEKRTPAKRLALQALERAYRKDVDDATSPFLRDAVPEGEGMRLTFWHTGTGLVLRGTAGFELCAPDGTWHPADPTVSDDTLYLSAPDVPHPIGARYAWINYGEVTLFTRAGLPAAPFCRMI